MRNAVASSELSVVVQPAGKHTAVIVEKQGELEACRGLSNRNSAECSDKRRGASTFSGAETELTRRIIAPGEYCSIIFRF